jgi:hypothetical protein
MQVVSFILRARNKLMAYDSRADKGLQLSRGLLKNHFRQAKRLEQCACGDIANARREAEPEPSFETFSVGYHGFSFLDCRRLGGRFWVGLGYWQGFFKLEKIEVLLNKKHHGTFKHSLLSRPPSPQGGQAPSLSSMKNFARWWRTCWRPCMSLKA